MLHFTAPRGRNTSLSLPLLRLSEPSSPLLDPKWVESMIKWGQKPSEISSKFEAKLPSAASEGQQPSGSLNLSPLTLIWTKKVPVRLASRREDKQGHSLLGVVSIQHHSRSPGKGGGY